ncbi:MAG: hypothetical protein EXS08_03030 [Planctomycetes bacterium]|nr:hypothetical protein [Planctomycetota bacterium]
MRNSAPWLALAFLALGCRSQPFGEIQRSDAPRHVEQAEAELKAGQTQLALEHLSAVNAVSGLDPDLRAREQSLLDEAARKLFEELADADSDALEELFDSELPERVRAQAGVLCAQRLLAEESRILAYRMVKKVDEALPGHSEWVLAGAVVAEAGLSLIRDDRRYKLLFHYRPRGTQALEYLVLNYPKNPRCPEAYFELSRVYEEDGDLDEAIQRTEDLLLYHAESVYATAASARLPYLRLLRVGRDDYDRSELLRAHVELEDWLRRNPGHELAAWATDLVRECDTRLVRSDLYLAHFYERTETPFGIRLHAARARELALQTGLEAEAEEASAILAGLPVETPAPTADGGR